MKIIEALKEEMKKSLKEVEDKTNKNKKNSINLLKKTRKTIKQAEETVQDAKTEIEAVKKAQREGILEKSGVASRIYSYKHHQQTIRYGRENHRH